MPRIKRYFPVSHDFNHDPEVIELRQTFGDWMAFVWQELLSISDRNDGEIRGNIDWIAASLTWLWMTNSKRYNTEWKRNKIRMGLEWMRNKHWISIESDSIHVLNHWKYHRPQERKPIPPILPILPNHPKIKNHGSEPALPEPSADASKKQVRKELDPRIKTWADQVYAIDPQKFAKLIEWIKAAERTYRPEVIATALERFLPYAGGAAISWWGYIDKILDKEEARYNGSKTAAGSDRYKKENGELARDMFGGTRLGLHAKR